MPRFHNVGGEQVKYTAQEEAARDAEEAQAALDSVETLRHSRYNEVDAEYIKRSLIAADAVTSGMGKVRGGSAKDRLAAISVKANARGNTPLKNALANVHDKLDALKDAIEAGDRAYLDAVDVIDDVHWD